MDEIIFYTSYENLAKIQIRMKKLPSLRFIFDPYIEAGSKDLKYRTGISGNVKDMDNLNSYLVEIEKPEVEKKKGLLERLAGAFGIN